MDERDRDRDRLERRPLWLPWAFTSLVLVVVAVVAYMFGTQHTVVTTAAGEPIRRMYWGFFPGFFFFWIFIWVIFGMFRRVWWSGGGYPYYGPWRYGRYYHPHDEEREWEEWHRREHERMDGSRGRGPSSSSSSSDRGPIT